MGPWNRAVLTRPVDTGAHACDKTALPVGEARAAGLSSRCQDARREHRLARHGVI